MRRIFFSLVVVSLVLLVSIAVQHQISAYDSELTVPLTSGESDQMVNGTWVPVEFEPIDDPFDSAERVPLSEGKNICSDATGAELSARENHLYLYTDATAVNGFTTEFDDPDISTCIDNLNQDPKGYRTVWYQFIAPATGNLKVEILPNAADYNRNYDTVLAVYLADTCINVSPSTLLACNDDTTGLLSEVELFVNKEEIYYVEIADRNLAVGSAPQVLISIELQSSSFIADDPAWTAIAEGRPNAHRSRHSTVVVDNEIYVIGGQIGVSLDAAERTSSMSKFNPATGVWTELAPMHPDCGNNKGYSNTDAAYITYLDITDFVKRIFLPSGFVGQDGDYQGLHCVYDIPSNTWSTLAIDPSTWSTGRPPAYSAIVSNGSSYIATGGLNGDWFASTLEGGVALNDTLEYTARADSWTQTVRPALTTERYAHTAAIIGPARNLLCVTGGLQPNPNLLVGGPPTLLSNGECLDLSNPSSTWQPINGTNVSRFNAASYVDDDGYWYVFGGVDGTLEAVPSIERFDFATQTWTTFDDRYDIDAPARAWMRGAAVNGAFYLIGGEAGIDGNGEGSVAGVVSKIEFLPPPISFTGLTNSLHLPIVYNNFVYRSLAQQATDLSFGETIYDSFDAVADKFNIYAFEVPASGKNIKLTLSDIPLGITGLRDDYDLLLLSESKVELASSTNISNQDEEITRSLTAGTYYVIVVGKINLAFDAGNYKLVLEEN